MLRRKSPPEHPQSAEIQQLTRQCLQGSGSDREESLRQLKGFGPGVIPEVAFLLTHEQFESLGTLMILQYARAERAVCELVQELLPQLLEALQDPQLSPYALDMLEARGNAEMASSLLELLEKGLLDFETQRYLWDWMGRTRCEEALPALLQQAQQQHLGSSEGAIRGLSYFSPPHSSEEVWSASIFPVLQEAILGDNANLSGALLQTLGRSGVEEIMPQALSFLSQGVEPARLAGAIRCILSLVQERPGLWTEALYLSCRSLLESFSKENPWSIHSSVLEGLLCLIQEGCLQDFKEQEQSLREWVKAPYPTVRREALWVLLKMGAPYLRHDILRSIKEEGKRHFVSMYWDGRTSTPPNPTSSYHDNFPMLLWMFQEQGEQEEAILGLLEMALYGLSHKTNEGHFLDESLSHLRGLRSIRDPFVKSSLKKILAEGVCERELRFRIQSLVYYLVFGEFEHADPYHAVIRELEEGTFTVKESFSLVPGRVLEGFIVELSFQLASYFEAKYQRPIREDFLRVLGRKRRWWKRTLGVGEWLGLGERVMDEIYRFERPTSFGRNECGQRAEEWVTWAVRCALENVLPGYAVRSERFLLLLEVWEQVGAILVDEPSITPSKERDWLTHIMVDVLAEAFDHGSPQLLRANSGWICEMEQALFQES